jgi:DNA-binding HxlR family transcriptional regulator
MECPVARSLAQIGDGWRVLIVRDALLGFRRFDEFEASLGIAPNILAKRLAALVADGLLVKRAYQQRPVRYEYVPTEKAKDFTMVIATLAQWGTRWLSPQGATVSLVRRGSSTPVESALLDTESGHRCRIDELTMVAGPVAGPEILQRSARLRARKEHLP